jgi:hypothetical protein
MRNSNKPNIILFVLLLLSTALAIVSFFMKGKGVSPVILVVQNKEYNYAGPDKLNSFWDNYPYWVILSQGRKIDSATMVVDSIGNKYPIAHILGDRDCILFRCSFTNDSKILDTTLSVIEKMKVPVLILTDETPGHHWQSPAALKTKTYVLQAPLPLAIEKGNLSYFFSLGKDLKTQAIFVPRKEIPDLTAKYLEYMRNYNKP